MCDIKFTTMTTTKFMDWLSKDKIYIESDLLGIMKTMTTRYLTKLHPHLLSPYFYFLGYWSCHPSFGNLSQPMGLSQLGGS